MAINFPNSPANNQLFLDTTSGNQYIYDAARTKWNSYSSQPGSITITLIDYGSIADIPGVATIDYGSLL